MQPNNNMANSTAPAPAPMTTPMNPGGDVVFKDKPKKNKGMIIGMIILAFLAAGGVGFGVWAFLSGNQKEAKLNEQISDLQSQLNSSSQNFMTDADENVDTIDKDLAQNLVNPYLVGYKYGVNILDSGLNEESKVNVAYYNLRIDDMLDNTIFYATLNNKYKYLFGNNEELGKKNYEVGYNTLVFDASNDRFSFNEGGGGGTGLTIVNEVKDIIINNGDVIVQVYHDNVPFCDEGESVTKYCAAMGEIDSSDNWMNSHRDEMPVYNMVFSQNNDHYVLTGIEKQ